MKRIRMFQAAFAASLLGLAGLAFGQEFPTKPVKIVVPWPTAGVTDTIARILADKLTPILGQPVIVENKPGATGAVGSEYVAKSAPDGHTLVLVSSSSHVMNPAIKTDLRYDPLKDFAYVSQLTRAPTIMVTSANFPAKTVAEVIKLAQAEPGKYNAAAFGTGSSSHLAAELFNQATGTKFTHVNYQGVTPAITDLMGERVHFFFDTISSSIGYVRGGRLKAIGVTGPQRSEAAPDVPAIAETVPGFEMTVWQGIGAPAGTPRPVIDKLNAALVKVMAMPDVRKRFQDLGAEPMATTPEQFTAHVASERRKWIDVANRANLVQK
jgi:tripartite-type tricarboxylate transporter receptor subunit TctC